jgi:hypothetical protein
MSEFAATFLEPKTSGDVCVPEVIGLYAMPISSNVQNTGDRIQTMVDRTGIPFFISDLFAQNRKRIFDMSAKAANQPLEPTYKTMSVRRLEFFTDLVGKHGLSHFGTLGMGDSLGVPAIQGMQYYGLEQNEGFDAILLRDGWNLGQSESKLRGFGHYISYTLKDELHKRRDHVTFQEENYGYSGEEFAQENETNILQKMWNVADMMRSHGNVEIAFQLGRLSADNGFAMNAVCLRQGLSGSATEQEKFVQVLLAEHEDATEEADSMISLRAEVVDGWHSDLLDPARGAHDVENTLDLLTPQY